MNHLTALKPNFLTTLGILPPAPRAIPKPKKPTAPRPVPTEAQYRRLLLNQVLIMILEANTRIAVEQGIWPGKADQLVSALHFRIDELFGLMFAHTSTAQGDWLNTIANLTEGAAASILSLACEQKPSNTKPMMQLLTGLAELSGLAEQPAPKAAPEAADISPAQLSLFAQPAPEVPQPAPEPLAGPQAAPEPCSEGCASCKGQRACSGCFLAAA